MVAPDRLLHAEELTALTNTIQQVARLSHLTSGTPAAGIGLGLEFEQETTPSNNEIIATIEAITTDITSGSEDADIVLKTMSGGAAVNERLRAGTHYTTISGGVRNHKTDAGAADYNPSALTSDYIITVDTTAAARAVIISTEDRDSGSVNNPRIFIIKDIAGNAGTNNITISLETLGNIDGAATAVIDANYNSITIMINGTNGYII